MQPMRNARKLWKGIVLKDVEDIADPLERIQQVVENSMQHYLGAGVFEGGCLLFNSLVEFSDAILGHWQSCAARFKAFSRLLYSWLKKRSRRAF